MRAGNGNNRGRATERVVWERASIGFGPDHHWSAPTGLVGEARPQKFEWQQRLSVGRRRLKSPVSIGDSSQFDGKVNVTSTHQLDRSTTCHYLTVGHDQYGPAVIQHEQLEDTELTAIWDTVQLSCIMR